MSEDEEVCSECHHLFDKRTGDLVQGWDRVYFVRAGEFVCGLCKDSVIESLLAGVMAK